MSNPMQINEEYNVRSRNYSEARDIPEGQKDRGLPNFNHMIHQVNVKDTYQPKLWQSSWIKAA